MHICPKKTLSIIIFQLLIIQFGICQHTNYELPPTNTEGKCFAKIKIGNIYEYYKEELPIYIGENSNNISLDSIFLDYVEEFDELLYLGHIHDLTKKEKKNLTKFEKIVYITDVKTINPDEYIMETITYAEILEERNYIEWREILCSKKFTPEIIRSVQDFLISHGYEIDTTLKLDHDALMDFQRRNNLPIGNLNIETQKVIGIF